MSNSECRKTLELLKTESGERPSSSSLDVSGFDLRISFVFRVRHSSLPSILTDNGVESTDRSVLPVDDTAEIERGRLLNWSQLEQGASRFENIATTDLSD